MESQARALALATGSEGNLLQVSTEMVVLVVKNASYQLVITKGKGKGVKGRYDQHK